MSTINAYRLTRNIFVITLHLIKKSFEKIYSQSVQNLQSKSLHCVKLTQTLILTATMHESEKRTEEQDDTLRARGSEGAKENKCGRYAMNFPAACMPACLQFSTVNLEDNLHT